MFDRAKIVDDNFRQFLNTTGGNGHKIVGKTNLQESSLTPAQLTDLLETQMISRLLDIKSRKLRKIGKSYKISQNVGFLRINFL